MLVTSGPDQQPSISSAFGNASLTGAARGALAALTIGFSTTITADRLPEPPETPADQCVQQYIDETKLNFANRGFPAIVAKNFADVKRMCVDTTQTDLSRFKDVPVYETSQNGVSFRFE
ncbi:MAG: hypothetical protein H6867_06975 [Rhodospirillales bacterium]|nr:hypothetical protein [Rhodospirillales bacterium]MCB9995292.1 hypothetical protein [Rhodospirillales bacterium]